MPPSFGTTALQMMLLATPGRRLPKSKNEGKETQRPRADRSQAETGKANRCTRLLGRAVTASQLVELSKTTRATLLLVAEASLANELPSAAALRTDGAILGKLGPPNSAKEGASHWATAGGVITVTDGAKPKPRGSLDAATKTIQRATTVSKPNTVANILESTPRFLTTYGPGLWPSAE